MPARKRPSPSDPIVLRRPGVMGGGACFRGTRVTVETLFVNLVDDDLDSIVDESFPTLDRDDCIAALERGAVLVAEAGLLTREEAQLLFGLLASKWHVSLDGFLVEYPEFSRDRCVAALRYAGAALAAEAEFETPREPVWWWIEISGRVEVARVRFEDGKGRPQPWRAEVVGSDRLIGPEDARLLVAVAPVVLQATGEDP